MMLRASSQNDEKGLKVLKAWRVAIKSPRVNGWMTK
jgi:hypothetical protein